MDKRTPCIDSVKGIACLAVILIHYNFPGELGIAVKTICRFAVPFFLCVSGFFLFNAKDSVHYRKSGVRKIKKVLSLLVCSVAFYTLFDILYNWWSNDFWNISAYSANVLTLKKVVKFWVTNDPFVYSHLWYLLALIYCYILMMFFKEKKSLGMWACLCPIGMLYFLAYGPYKEVLGLRASWNISIGTETITVYRFNFFWARALPFFVLGIIFRNRQAFITKINVEKAMLKIFIFLGLAVSLFERCFLNESQWYFGTILVVVSIFIWVIKYPDSGNETMTYIGRNLSMYVYIIHIAVGKAIGTLAAKEGIADKNMYIYSKPFLIMAVSLTCAYGIYVVKEKVTAGRKVTTGFKKSA